MLLRSARHVRLPARGVGSSQQVDDDERFKAMMLMADALSGERGLEEAELKTLSPRAAT